MNLSRLEYFRGNLHPSDKRLQNTRLDKKKNSSVLKASITRISRPQDPHPKVHIIYDKRHTDSQITNNLYEVQIKINSNIPDKNTDSNITNN